MERKLRISFFWFGFDGRYGKWNDGLYRAMKYIEEEHEVKYFDVNDENIKECNEWKPDVVLFWEAPCTARGQDAPAWFKVCNLPFKKILLFAGGPLEAMDVVDFEMVLVESQINEDDCERQGIPYMRAFGINDDIFKPMQQAKVIDAFFQATCAGWKRQPLLSDALGKRIIFAGRGQINDPYPFEHARKKSLVLPELPMEAVATLINSSHTVVNGASFWGGGQRTTLEAMACGTPPIVMSDSPKNREYVEESGFGVVCDPDEGHIRRAVDELINNPQNPQKGIDYIKSKWTARHYADNILKAITQVISNA